MTQLCMFRDSGRILLSFNSLMFRELETIKYAHASSGTTTTKGGKRLQVILQKQRPFHKLKHYGMHVEISLCLLRSSRVMVAFYGQ